jgi:hypothetical protein
VCTKAAPVATDAKGTGRGAEPIGLFANGRSAVGFGGVIHACASSTCSPKDVRILASAIATKPALIATKPALIATN